MRFNYDGLLQVHYLMGQQTRLNIMKKTAVSSQPTPFLRLTVSFFFFCTQKSDVTSQNKYDQHDETSLLSTVVLRILLASWRGTTSVQQHLSTLGMNRRQVKRRFQALASSRHINLNDLLASSFFKRRRWADFFLPAPEIAVSPAQRLLMLAFSCLFFTRLPVPSLAERDIPTHSSFDIVL